MDQLNRYYTLRVLWVSAVTYVILTVIRALYRLQVPDVAELSVTLSLYIIWVVALSALIYRHILLRRREQQDSERQHANRQYMHLLFTGGAISLGLLLNYGLSSDTERGLSGNTISDLFDLTAAFAFAYLVCATIAIIPRWRMLRSELQMPATAPNDPEHLSEQKGFRLDNGNSLGAEGADRLRRQPFADYIARLVETHEIGGSALTIGLYGPWGSGKSSIFDMIERTFRKQSPGLIFLRYEPWFFGKDAAGIIPNFLTKLAKTLREAHPYDTELPRALSYYARKLAPVSLRIPGLIVNMKEWFAGSAQGLEMAEAEELRDNIHRLLQKQSKPIVVFIDDLDRLDNKEIQTVFKMVRLAANFPNVVYVIALDEDIVARSLAQLYSKDYEEAVGKAYLEKFIQVPLYMPAADQQDIAHICWHEIKPLLENSDVLPDKTEFIQTIEELQMTPRNAYRFLNACRIFVPLLKDEINAVDLIGLLLIKINVPSLFAYIQRQADYFTSQDGQEHSQDVSELLADKYAKYVPLLGRLFPLPRRSPQTEQRGRHLSSKDYFSTYFMYAVPLTKVSIREIGELREKNKLETETFLTRYKNLVKRTSQEEVHAKLTLALESWEMAEKRLLFTHLLVYYRENRRTTNPGSIIDLLTRIARELLDMGDEPRTALLRTLEQEPEYAVLLERMTSMSAAPDAVREEIAKWLDASIQRHRLQGILNYSFEPGTVFFVWYRRFDRATTTPLIREFIRQGNFMTAMKWLELAYIDGAAMKNVQHYARVLECLSHSETADLLDRHTYLGEWSDALQTLQQLHNRAYRNLTSMLNGNMLDGSVNRRQLSAEVQTYVLLYLKQGEPDQVDTLQEVYDEYLDSWGEQPPFV